MAGILSQGLRIAPPEAPATGYMFGKGVYFADMISKSANYCVSDGTTDSFLLLCEVALGKQQEEKEAKYIKKPKKGYDSVKGERSLILKQENSIYSTFRCWRHRAQQQGSTRDGGWRHRSVRQVASEGSRCDL